jgi:hypothetical protein
MTARGRSRLDGFSAARGFEVVPKRRAIPMDVIVGVPAMLATKRGEQLFMRWRTQS